MKHFTLNAHERATLGPVTRAALDAANGYRAGAAESIGISIEKLYNRIAECENYQVGISGTLKEYADGTWPTHKGGNSRATKVLNFAVEGKGVDRVFVYTLGCGTPDAPHVNRVPSERKQRAYVVCRTCHPAPVVEREYDITERVTTEHVRRVKATSKEAARAVLGGTMVSEAVITRTVRSTTLAA
jgi:hypothetical protein